MTSKRPRHYAQEILKAKTREERLKLLESAPTQYRELIKKHVEISWKRR
jgi:hypothetical protein